MVPAENAETLSERAGSHLQRDSRRLEQLKRAAEGGSFLGSDPGGDNLASRHPVGDPLGFGFGLGEISEAP
jgi:hypothetical protein